MKSATTLSIAALTAALLLATPAAGAGDATPISAPDDIALFALGVAGLLFGRRYARGRKRDED